MNEKDYQAIEAYFDGETNPEETSRIERLIERDPAAREHLAGLEETRVHLKASHPETLPPESWEVLAKKQASQGQESAARLIPFPRMVTAAAAIVVLGMVLWYPLRQMGIKSDEPMALETSVEFVETDLVGATPVVYLDQPSGWTVVWVVEEDPPSGS